MLQFRRPSHPRRARLGWPPPYKNLRARDAQQRPLLRAPPCAAAGLRRQPHCTASPSTRALGELRPSPILLSALNFVAQVHRKDRNTPAPVSLAPPSRHLRRAFRSEPQITSTTPPVGYACRWLRPRPNHGPNRALGRRLDLLRSRTAAEQGVPASRAAPTSPNRPGRPISDGRPRLEPKPFRSRPSDLDPSAQMQRYRFALAFLLKRPWSFL